MEAFRDEDTRLSVSGGTALNPSNSHNSLDLRVDQLTSLPQPSSAKRHQVFIHLTTSFLRNGHSVGFVTRGGSMYSTIRDGETITVKPTSAAPIRHRDILLYERAGNIIAHRIIFIIENSQSPVFDRVFLSTSLGFSSRSHRKAPRFLMLRGNAFKMCDEPVSIDHVLGNVVYLERHGCKIRLDSLGSRLFQNIVVSLVRCRNHISKTGSWGFETYGLTGVLSYISQ